MNKEAAYLLHLLKNFIGESKPEARKDVDWEEMIRLANIHAVTGILGYMVMKHPLESTAGVSGLMRNQCLQYVRIFAQRAELMKKRMDQMNALGIDHLLFKGYVVREFYPVPELRSFGDIDFLIRPEDRAKSHKLMLDEGFERKTDWEPVYSYVKDSEFYEIHTDVMEVDVSGKADYKGYFKQIWDHARRVEEHTWELTPEFHFLYLLTHIAKHISGSGAGIRMYLDIAVFIRHYGDSLNWGWIAGELQKLALADFANVVLQVTERWFGVKSPLPLRAVPEKVLEDFMDFTMEGGVFGYVNRDAGMIALKREERNAENVTRHSALLHRAFPSAGSLESRYTYLQNRHWLLPVAWVHRFVRTRDAWEQHRQEAKSILSVNSEKVVKLKRIYKEIGL